MLNNQKKCDLNLMEIQIKIEDSIQIFFENVHDLYPAKSKFISSLLNIIVCTIEKNTADKDILIAKLRAKLADLDFSTTTVLDQIRDILDKNLQQ